VYTASYFDRLPMGYVKIGISRGVPRGMQGVPRIPSLQPGPWFRTADNETYRAKYVGILASLDPTEIVAEIDAKAQGQIPVLCCYERFGSGDWCHRSYISAWLCARLGFIIPEFADLEKAYGGDHPMLPVEYRAKQSS
jgi:hypothetical protein